MAANSPTFTKTPQAKDDSFTNTGLTEDSLGGIKTLDVMANDLGSGNMLFSLADGKSEGDSRLKALSTQDAVGAVNLTTLGAKVWITADGKVAYDASALSTAQFQRLAAGESATDSFTYAIKLSNGTLSWATAKVQITGANDAPVISVNVLTIDGDSSSGKVKGTLLYTDADQGDKHTSSTTLKPLIASAGTPDLSASLNLALHTSINDEGENGKGALKWDFALPSTAPKLAAGQGVLANYQLSIADNHGGISAPQELTLLILGTGSNTKVYTVAAHADLTELSGRTGSTVLDQASGVVSGKDLGLEDKGALSSVLVMSSWSTGNPIPSAAAAALASALSTSTVPTSKSGESDKTIAWQFGAQDKTFDFLAAGETLTLAYRVSSAKEQDGKSQIITLTVTGANDAPVITSNAADAAGAVTEDAALTTATGTLGASDVDQGAAQAWSVVGSAAGTYGSLAVDAITGQWTYTLNNDYPAVQALAEGETQNETFTVRVTDDQAATADQSVTVAVVGTNDDALFVDDVTSLKKQKSHGHKGDVFEDSNPSGTESASGQVAFSDVDLLDHHSVTGVTPVGTTLGSLTAAVSQDTSGTGTDGLVEWTYTVDDSVIQNLAQGERYQETFTVALNDGTSTVTQDVTVTIVGSNDAPVITSAAQTGAVTEDSSVTPTATGTVSFTDVDLIDTHAAIVAAAAGNTTSLGTLTLGSLHDATNGATGTQAWTYTLDNAKADYLAAGQTVTENYTITVTDNNGATATQNVVVTITGTNEAPVIAAQAQQVFAENFNALATSGQHNGGQYQSGLPVEYAAAMTNWLAGGTNAFHGVQTSSGNAALMIYQGGSPNIATEANSIAANALGQSYQVGFDVAPAVYQDPSQESTAADQVVVQVVDSSGHVVGNFAASGGAFPSSGAPTFTSHTFTYTGAGTGNVHFVIQGSNPGANRFAGAIDNLTLTTGNQSASLAETTNAADTLSANGSFAYTDVDKIDTHAVSVVNPANAVGTLTATDTNGTVGWTYSVPNASIQYLAAGEQLAQTFTVRVDDHHGGIATTPVTVTINGTNEAPVITSYAAAATGAVKEDTILSASGHLTASDADHNATQAWSVLGNATGAYGTLAVGATTGEWTYTLNNASAAVQTLVGNDHKTESFAVQVADGQGGTATQNVTVTVNGIDKAPVAQNDTNALTVTTVASQAHSNTVNWVNWTSATVTSTEAYSLPGYGNGTSNIGTVTGTLNLGNGQTVGVTYSGEFSFTQTNGGTYYYTGPTGSNGTYTSAAVANAPPDSDIIALFLANTPRTLTFSQPVNNLFFAVVSLNGNGYIFDQDFQVASNGPGYWGSGTLTRQALGNGTYEVVGSGEPHGVLSINGSVQKLTWTSAGNENWNGFTVGTYGVAQTATASGNLLANDSDPRHQALSVTAVDGQQIVGNSITLTLSSGAHINVNKDGTYLYDVNSAFASLGQGQPTTDSFQYTIANTQGLTASANLTVNITGINDAPTITSAAASGSVTEDSALTSSGQLSATDPDQGATLAWSVLSANGTVGSNTGGYGSLLLDGTGKWTYTLNNNSPTVQSLSSSDHKSENFVVQVSDGLGGTATQTVTVAVNGTNDAPVAAPDTASATEAGGVNNGTPGINPTGNVLTNDINVDAGNNLSATVNSMVPLQPQVQLQDASFETPAVGGDGHSYFAGNVSGWTYTTYSGVSLWYGFPNQSGPGPDGSKVGFIQSYAGSQGSISQSFSGAAGNYTLQFDAGQRVYSWPDGYQAMDFQVLFDGKVVGTYLTVGPNYQHITVPIVAATSGTHTLAFQSLNSQGLTDGPIEMIDKVQLSWQGAPLTGAYGTLSMAANGNYTYVVDQNNSQVNALGATQSLTDVLGYTVTDSRGATSQSTLAVTINGASDAYVLSNLANNGSFEQFSGGGTSAGSAAITGWTVTGSDVDRVVSSGWQSGDGAYSLDLNGFHPGGVSQVLQTTPGVQYTVGFDLSKNPGDTTYAAVRVSAAGTSVDYTFSSGNTAANMMWSQKTFTFTATGTSTTLSFASTYPNDSTGGFPINAQGPALDEVVVFANKTIGSFSKGAGGDVLHLHDLLTSVSAPHDSSAFTNGYLRFLPSGSNTLVQIDSNGGGDAYLTVATIVGQLLSPTDASNYVL